MDEWHGFRDVVAVSFVLGISQGDEQVDSADTMHLIKRGEFYYWGMPDLALEECEGQ